MALFNIRWPGQKAQSEQAPLRRSRSAQAESVDDMRRRARHRLIGAAVLVVLGVVGFPILFDTQPRPIPVNVPIEIPDRNEVAPLMVPGPAAPTDEAAPSLPALNGPVPAPDLGLADGEALLPAAPVVPSAPLPAVIAKLPEPPRLAPEPKPEVAEPVAKPKPEPARVVESKPEPVPAPAPKPVDKSKTDEAARARALLEGRPAPAPVAAAEAAKSGRFIVQVGAFADASKANEVRSKLERAGLKTYTQVVDTKDGKRTRVRVGPFDGRDDADKAAARIKSQGLAASVLTL